MTGATQKANLEPPFSPVTYFPLKNNAHPQQSEFNPRLFNTHKIWWPNWNYVYMGEGIRIELLHLTQFNLHMLGTLQKIKKNSLY